MGSSHLKGTGEVQRGGEHCWLREPMKGEVFDLGLESWGEFF